MLLSYRNQLIDLHSNSIDWFLYDGNTDTYWVNQNDFIIDAFILNFQLFQNT